MAECLLPIAVSVDKFFTVYVANTDVKSQVRTVATRQSSNLSVKVNEHMFL